MWGGGGGTKCNKLGPWPQGLTINCAATLWDLGCLTHSSCSINKIAFQSHPHNLWKLSWTYLEFSSTSQLEHGKSKPGFSSIHSNFQAPLLTGFMNWKKKCYFSVVLMTSFGGSPHREEMRCVYDLLCHFMAIFCLHKIVPHWTIAYLSTTNSCHEVSPTSF